MHEGAVCREIMDITERAAKIHGLSKIYQILVAHSLYAGLHEEQLNFYFDVAKKGTIMEEGTICLELDETLPESVQMSVRSISGE